MYLVVGASGYLGSYLVRAILENTKEKILAVSRSVHDGRKKDREGSSLRKEARGREAQDRCQDRGFRDKDGNEYKNYGTYIMRKYYENPENFKNSYNFIHNVCPGFYIKSTDGLGVMSEVYLTELVFFYNYIYEDSVYHGNTLLSGTEEVMQTTHIDTDKDRLTELASDESCTHLKTPAGIFTEVTLPVDDIKYGHENDTLSGARVVFQCMNQTDAEAFDEPEYVLMLPKDSLYSFFENKNIPNNTTSFIGMIRLFWLCPEEQGDTLKQMIFPEGHGEFTI